MAETYAIDAPAVALVAATAKTVAVAASGSNTLRVVDLTVCCDYTTSATPIAVKVELVKYTNAGTNTAQTPTRVNGEAQNRAPISTGGINCTVEPTGPTVLKTWSIIFPGGPFELQGPQGRELAYLVNAGFIGVRCTASAACNIYVNLQFEE